MWKVVQSRRRKLLPNFVSRCCSPGLCTKAVSKGITLNIHQNGPRKDILQRVPRKQRVKTKTRRPLSKFLPHIWNLLKPYTKRPPKDNVEKKLLKAVNWKNFFEAVCVQADRNSNYCFKDMQWKFAGWGNWVFDFCWTICKKSGRQGQRGGVDRNSQVIEPTVTWQLKRKAQMVQLISGSHAGPNESSHCCIREKCQNCSLFLENWACSNVFWENWTRG